MPASPGRTCTTWEYPVEDWRDVLSINLDGPFHCCRAVVPVMIAQNYGRIVNIASIAGKEGNPNAPAYSASKAGVIALTKSLGKELADHDIAVNCITPAAAKTAIFDQMTQQHIDFMLSKIPRGRFVTGRGDRGARRLLRLGRLLVHDRRGVRHFRRTGDLLTDPALQRRQRLTGIALMCGAVAIIFLSRCDRQISQPPHGYDAGGVGALFLRLRADAAVFQSDEARRA